MLHPDRPARTYVTDPLTRAARIVGLLAAISLAAWLLVLYPSLPEVVPTHFDATGQADAWGSKASILVFAAVMVATAALLAWISTKPHAANYPVRVTDDNAQAVYREGERMLVWLLWAVTALFGGIALLIAGLPGMAPLLVGTGGMLVVLAVGIVRIVRAAR